MFLLLGVPFALSHGGTLVLGFLPIACLVPFAVMPLFYVLLHRVDTLLFGRYHLAMPLSAFLAASALVIAFSGVDGGAGSACLLFFGAVVFAPALLLYRYCAFSVRARLGGTSPTFAALFTLLGGAVAFGAFCGFLAYDPATACLNTAYVVGGCIVIVAMVQYLATHYGIPELGGRRALSVKSAFRMFYTQLDKRRYFSSLLFTASFAALAALCLPLSMTVGASAAEAAGIGLGLVCAYGAVRTLCVFAVSRRSIALSAVQLLLFVCTAGLLSAAVFAELSHGSALTVLTVAALFTGAGGAVAHRQAVMRLTTVKSDITGGAVTVLGDLLFCGAFAIALAAAAIATSVENNAIVFAIGVGVAALSAIAAFVLAGKRSIKREPMPDVTYEKEPVEDGKEGSGPEQENGDKDQADAKEAGEIPDASANSKQRALMRR